MPPPNRVLALEAALFALGFWGLLVGPLLVPLARRAVRRIVVGLVPGPPAGWGLLELLAPFLVGLFATVAVQLVPGDTTVAVLVKGALVQAAAALACMAVALRSGPEGLGALGMSPEGQRRALAAGTVAYALLLPLLLGLLRLWMLVAEAFGLDPGSQEVLHRIGEAPAADLPVLLLLAVIVIPFFEELVFRGFLQPLLERRLGVVGGIAVASLAFALLHPKAVFGGILFFSLLLGWLRWRTGRLASSWGAHALHNGLMLALLLGTDEA